MSETLEDLKESMRQFDAIDYGVFIFMLASCSFVGLYFAYQDHVKNKKSDKNVARRGSAAKEYLMGGRNMQILPVAMSLVATHVSGITLLGTGTEVYLYGIQYVYILVGPYAMCYFMCKVMIPVFHNLNVTSMYEVRKREEM